MLNLQPLQWKAMTTEINRMVLAGQPFTDSLDFTFLALDLLIPYDRIGIALVEGEGADKKLVLKWVRSKLDVKHIDTNYSAPIAGTSLERILGENEPRIIRDLVSYLREHPTSTSTALIIKDGMRSSLTCPLHAEGRQVGVVFFSSSETERYSEKHIAVFSEIATELSIIVNHGQLRADSKRAEEQKANYAMILHDLRAPLGVIRGYTELAIEEDWYKDLDTDGKKVFEVLLRNSHYMFGLLDDLDVFSNVTQSSKERVYESLPLQTALQEWDLFGQALVIHKAMEFSSDHERDDDRIIHFERENLHRILDNLFSNAVKYSPRGSRLIFQVNVRNECLHFSVRDHGPGIPSHEIHKLFKAFGKTSVRPTENESSTGLGLAIAKTLVEQLGGQISVESVVGQGSNFKFTMPLKTSA